MVVHPITAYADRAYEIFSNVYDRFIQDKKRFPRAEFHFEWVIGVSQIAQDLYTSDKIAESRLDEAAMRQSGWYPKREAPTTPPEGGPKHTPTPSPPPSKPKEGLLRNEKPVECHDCGKVITGTDKTPAHKIVDYSVRNFGYPLCFACQNDEKKRRGEQ